MLAKHLKNKKTQPKARVQGFAFGADESANPPPLPVRGSLCRFDSFAKHLECALVISNALREPADGNVCLCKKGTAEQASMYDNYYATATERRRSLLLEPTCTLHQRHWIAGNGLNRFRVMCNGL